MDTYNSNADTFQSIFGYGMIESINIYREDCFINWWARKAVTFCCGSHSFSKFKLFNNPEA